MSISTTIQHPTGHLEIKGMSPAQAAKFRDSLFTLARLTLDINGFIEQRDEWQERALKAEEKIADAARVREEWCSRALRAESLVRGTMSEWEERALKAESDNRALRAALEAKELEVHEYKRQGGTINMERSWKGKYRNALAEANQRLIDAGSEPVRIRNKDSDTTVIGVGNGAVAVLHARPLDKDYSGIEGATGGDSQNEETEADTQDRR